MPVLTQPPANSRSPSLRTAMLTPDDAGQLAAVFAALGDPVRLRLLSLLASSGQPSVCACDLVEPVGKSQPTVSHHLRVLREAGLVTSEKRGVNVWYAVVPAALEALRGSLAAGEVRGPGRSVDPAMGR